MVIMDLCILLIILLALTYHRVNPVTGSIVVGATLVILSVLGHLGFFSLLILWCLFIAAAAFINLPRQRIQYIIHPLTERLKKFMPTISNTEREAIEAGDVWWEKELFCGAPDWQKLHALPAPLLTVEEQSFLDNQVETLCAMLHDWDISVQQDLPKAAWDFLKQERFFSIVMPKEYGGKGFSAFASSSIVIKLATRCGSAAVTTMVPNSLGPGELLLHYGTQAQKDHYLPKLGDCSEIPCFALTGAESGSDAGAMRDTGIVCRQEVDGKQVIGIKLNWDKRYITLAPVATLLGLAFYLYDPENVLGKGTDIGITLCLIPTVTAGVEIGNRHHPMGISFMNGPTRGKDVFVPVDAIIGGVEMAGQGWRMLMECLSIGRGISLPALSTACSLTSYRATGAYATIRKQFNTSISNFEGIEEGLAVIAGTSYQLEACRRMSAGAVDLKIRPSIVSAITKYHTTELARIVIGHAMDIHAGAAIQMGPRNFMAAAHLAIPVSITVEGANILTRNLIIFGQGAIRCHPYVLEEIGLFAEPTSTENLKQIDKTLMSHIGYFLSNLSRTFVGGITGGWIFKSPVSGAIAPYYRQLTRMSAAMALLSDMSMMLLGGSLKRREYISARLGDILSQLYLSSSVLKYFNDNGKPVADIDYVEWCIQTSLSRMQIAIDDLLENFPQRWIGKIMQFVVFPWGRAYRKPSDAQSKKLMQCMLQPSELRERLTQNVFISENPNDPIKRLEIAFGLRAEIEPIYKKFNAGIRSGAITRHGEMEVRTTNAVKLGLITETERAQLLAYEKLEHEIVKVDEFSFDMKTVLS